MIKNKTRVFKNGNVCKAGLGKSLFMFNVLVFHYIFYFLDTFALNELKQFLLTFGQQIYANKRTLALNNL